MLDMTPAEITILHTSGTLRGTESVLNRNTNLCCLCYAIANFKLNKLVENSKVCLSCRKNSNTDCSYRSNTSICHNEYPLTLRDDRPEAPSLQRCRKRSLNLNSRTFKTKGK